MRDSVWLRAAQRMREWYSADQSAAGIKPGPLDHQNGVQRHEASAGCALGASSLESGNAREATCLNGEHDARRCSPTQQGQLGTNAGSIPAAPTDPITDLCARLRDYSPFERQHVVHDAADALERLARERDGLRTMLQNMNRDAARLADIANKYKWQVRDTCTRAERAEAERDAMRECIGFADMVRKATHPGNASWALYDAARAALKGEV